jgi:lipopolysaccharide/colanic/teichoic acid biosynthesis glycosyltransferase
MAIEAFISAPVETTGSLHSARWKRFLDVFVALAMLAATWPLFLAVALAVKLSSPGPVFFVQRRVGRGNCTFSMVKFRSMYLDAEKRRSEVVAQSDRSGICIKLKRDPRITPLGRILRRWSIDELPQLFNVLAGDMSIVGPRPALEEEVAAYPKHAHRRHAVSPGITGLWQVSGRADIGFEKMIELDLEYVHRSSLLFDMHILLRTVGVVLTGRGAY